MGHSWRQRGAGAGAANDGGGADTRYSHSHRGGSGCVERDLLAGLFQGEGETHPGTAQFKVNFNVFNTFFFELCLT